jgi:hypothetical protein
MALELSYYAGTDAVTRMIYGAHVGTQVMTLTSSSANSTAIPANAALARVRAGENCRFLKNTDGTNAGVMAITATTGQYLAAGETMDVYVKPSGATSFYFTAMTV